MYIYIKKSSPLRTCTGRFYAQNTLLRLKEKNKERKEEILEEERRCCKTCAERGGGRSTT
jgi:hypothetical protein